MGAEAPRLFRLVRTEDESGVSGTGHVADGVAWHDGTCTVHWRTQHTSTTVYRDFATVLAIHGHGGKTTAVFAETVRIALADGIVTDAEGADIEAALLAAEADIAATRAALLAPGHHAVGRGGVVLSWSHDIPEAIRAKLRAAVVADAREHGDHTPHAYDPPMDVRGECERVAMLNRRRRSVATYTARKAALS